MIVTITVFVIVMIAILMAFMLAVILVITVFVVVLFNRFSIFGVMIAVLTRKRGCRKTQR